MTLKQSLVATSQTHIGTPPSCLLSSIRPTALVFLFSKQCLDTIKRHAADQTTWWGLGPVDHMGGLACEQWQW
jgi:hypothetical protein